MNDLTIYILTYNRPELILETLKSILNQTKKDFELIISDNSTNNFTQKILTDENYINKIKYIKRDKEYTSQQHFQLCLEEVKTKYFMLCHDDDILYPEMINNLYDVIKTNKYVGVGCNCHFMFNNAKSKKKMLKERKNLIIENNEQLLYQYYKCSIVPYPSYMYNKDLIGSKRISESAGKYSDVSTLSDWLLDNKFYWIHTPLFLYRIHKKQDSAKYDYLAQLKLINYFKKIINNTKLIRYYRIQQIYRNCVFYKVNFNLKQKRGVILLKKISFFNYYLKYVIKAYILKTV